MKVVAGILVKNGKVLIARRASHKSMAGKWEFPGGKVEPGESCEEALERELYEEFRVRIRAENYLGDHHHDYGSFTIQLHVYYASYLEGVFSLTDHDDIAWVNRDELGNYDLAEADLPFVERIRF